MVRAYLNGVNIFLAYLSTHQIEQVTSEILEVFFYHCKKELGYSYSMMKQLVASVQFLFEEVLNEDLEFNFHIKMKKPVVFQLYSRLKRYSVCYIPSIT